MTPPKPYEAVLDLDALEAWLLAQAATDRAAIADLGDGPAHATTALCFREHAERLTQALALIQQHRRVVEALRGLVALVEDMPDSDWHEMDEARAALALTSLCEEKQGLTVSQDHAHTHNAAREADASTLVSEAALQAKVRSIVDFTIADARLHDNLDDLSDERGRVMGEEREYGLPSQSCGAGLQADAVIPEVERPAALGWPRVIDAAPWFAWRPVRLTSGRWRWLVHVKRFTWLHRIDVYTWETSTYALLP